MENNHTQQERVIAPPPSSSSSSSANYNDIPQTSKSSSFQALIEQEASESTTAWGVTETAHDDDDDDDDEGDSIVQDEAAQGDNDERDTIPKKHKTKKKKKSKKKNKKTSADAQDVTEPCLYPTQDDVRAAALEPPQASQEATKALLKAGKSESKRQPDNDYVTPQQPVMGAPQAGDDMAKRQAKRKPDAVDDQTAASLSAEKQQWRKRAEGHGPSASVNESTATSTTTSTTTSLVSSSTNTLWAEKQVWSNRRRAAAAAITAGQTNAPKQQGDTKLPDLATDVAPGAYHSGGITADASTYISQEKPEVSTCVRARMYVC